VTVPKLQPELAFIGFFNFNDESDLGDELGFRTASAGGSIVRRNRRSRVEELIANPTALPGVLD
jgi:hypothetical protein